MFSSKCLSQLSKYVMNVVLSVPCKAKVILKKTQFKVSDIIFYALTSKEAQ